MACQHSNAQKVGLLSASQELRGLRLAPDSVITYIGLSPMCQLGRYHECLGPGSFKVNAEKTMLEADAHPWQDWPVPSIRVLT